MKIKKLLAVLLLVTLAATVFAACDVIKKNDGRSFGQTLATVSYNGLSSTIKKGEFENSFNSYAYYYIYYYGYTVDKAAETTFDSLARRKLLILFVRDHFAKEQGKDNKVKADELLNEVERNEAVKSANGTMQTSYDSTFEDLWKEYMAVPGNEESYYRNHPDLAPDGYFDDHPNLAPEGYVSKKADEDKKEDKVKKDAPRPARPAKAGAKVDYSADLKAEDRVIPFFDQESHYKDDYTSEQKAVSDKTVNEMKKILEKNFVSYEYYYDNACEEQLLLKFRREYENGFKREEKAAEIEAGYRERIDANRENFAKGATDAYKAALSNLPELVYHPADERGHGYVFNVLLSFSEEQKAKLNEQKKLLSGTDLEKYRAKLAEKIKVNVSNPYYDAAYSKCEACQAHADDPDKPACDDPFCPAKMYARENVPAAGEGGILQEIKGVLDDIDAGNVAKANETLKKLGHRTVDGKDEYYVSLDESATLTDYEKFVMKREAVTAYVYLVNDDPGMYDKDKNNKITGKGLGYLITPEGKHSDWVPEFTDLGRQLVKTGLGSMGWCETDFGYHLMFTSYIPFGETFVDGSKAAGTAKSSETASEDDVIVPEYIVKYGRYGDPNDMDETLADTVFAGLRNAYAEKQYNIAAEKSVAEHSEKNIVKNERLWKKLLEQYKKDYDRK